MIEVNLIEDEIKEFQPCLACGSKENVREVSFGVTKINQTVRLCKDCIGEINENSSNLNL